MELSPTHPLYTANDFYRQRLGTKVIKLALDGGFTCPNRDGSLSYRGCIFCSGKGSGDFTPGRGINIEKQIALMKEKMREKWDSGVYMAYFQAFTNTYAPVDHLRQVYTEAINCPDVVALSVATRPDCIDTRVCDLLKELSERVYVCVELGLQTSSDTTGRLINRCYETPVYDRAMDMLREYGIDTITHIILGLPGEDIEQMKASVLHAVNKGTTGLKLQLLHILKGTALAEMYEREPFPIFTFEEYTSLIVELAELIPPHVAIHRITGDGDKTRLIEPRWSLDKRRVLNQIHRLFRQKNSFQGCAYIKSLNS